jgi:hypothetical protein
VGDEGEVGGEVRVTPKPLVVMGMLQSSLCMHKYSPQYHLINVSEQMDNSDERDEVN